MTLRLAAERVLSPLEPAPLPLGPASRRALIAELTFASSRRQDLGPLQELLESPGLVDHLASRFRQLRRDGVDASQAAGALRRTDGERAGGVLARIYRDYLQALDRGRLADDEGLTLAAIESFPRFETPPRRLLIDLPLPIAPIEERMVQAIASRADEVFVSLAGPGDDANDKAIEERLPAAPETQRRWESLLGHPLPRIDAGSTSAVAVGLQTVRRGLFDHQAAPDGAAEGVRITAGSNAHDTARRVARRIKEQLADGRAKPSDIVIAAPRLDSSAPRYAEALSEAGVPVAIDAAPRLSAAAVTHAVLDLLAVAVTDGAFSALIALLGRSDLPALNRGKAPDGFASTRAATEWFLRELQIPSGRRYVQRQAETLTSREGESDTLRRLRTAADAAVGVLEPLNAALDDWPTEATPLGWLDAVDEALQALGHPGLTKSADPADRGAGDALEEACSAIENLAVWRKRSPRLLRLRGAHDLFRSWSTRLRLPVREPSEGRVRVVGVPTALGLPCEHLVVVDADETAFAAEAGDTGQAMLAFYELVSVPSKSLTFAYAALDSAAQPLSPSPYVTDVERLFAPGATRTGEAPLLASIDLDGAPTSPHAWRSQAVVRAKQEGDGAQLAAYDASGSPLLGGLTAIDARARGDAFGEWEGVLTGAPSRKALAERYGPEHLWSASQLELMATCPYKFFARQVLRLDEVGELTLGVDYRRRGSLMHDALAECLDAISGELGPGRSLRDVPPEQLSQRLAAKIDELADIGKLPAHEAALCAIEARQATDWAERYAAQQHAFDAKRAWSAFDRPLTPTLLEARFGPARGVEGAEDSHSVDEPFGLTLPGGETLLLTGRIDRIDTARLGEQTLFTVVDYKTGKNHRTSLEQIESGKQLQPVLYAMAAKEMFFDDDAVPVAAGYWAVRRKGFVAPPEKDLPVFGYEDGRVRPSDQWASTVEAVTRRCEEIVQSVRRGEFPMHNDDDQCGSRCEFRTVCRVAQARSLGKLPPSGEDPKA